MTKYRIVRIKSEVGGEALIIEKEWIYLDLEKDKAEHMGAVWNDRMDLYRLPNTIGVLKELKLMNKLSDHGLRHLKIKHIRRMKFLTLKNREDAAGSDKLRPYQRVDVSYLKHLDAAGIFNEQRTGKTPTTLTLLEEKGFKKIIIVVPAGLMLNWEDEVEQWTHLVPYLAKGKKKQREKLYTSLQEFLTGYCLIISYETLRNDLTNILQLVAKTKTETIVLDEAHRLRSYSPNPKKGSQVAKAVMKIGHRIPHRYALTGTPVVKEGEEIWKILHFLYPDRFPGYWQFLDRYFEVKHNGFGQEVKGYKRKDELQEILSLISVNRKRREVMKWLPRKQYQTIKLEMNDKQRKVYESVRDTFVYEDVIDAPSVLAQLTRLRQIATAPGLLVGDVPSEKEKFVLEWLQDHPNESIVIFGTFSSYLEKLQGKIEGSELITGGVSKNERDRITRDFQAGRTKVLLANIKAAGVGLTLDKGETIIFLDKEYNPSDNEQAEDRIVPTSKERNHSMHIISLVMQDTVEEAIHGLLKHKHDITKVINNGGIEALERLWKEYQHE